MTSDSSNGYLKSIDTTPMSLIEMSLEEDECYGSFSDFSDFQSQTDESVTSTEDWIARWPLIEPVEIFQ